MPPDDSIKSLGGALTFRYGSLPALIAWTSILTLVFLSRELLKRR